MASEAIITKMRRYFRNSSRFKKASIIVWLACCLLVYSSTQIHRAADSYNRTHLYLNPAEDPQEKAPITLIPSEIPNLPLAYIRNPYDNSLYGDRKCGHYPKLWDLKYNNFYWQLLRGKQASFYLFSAFYDNRNLTPNSPSIRILGMIDKSDTSKFKVYCQIWFEGVVEPIVTKIREYNYIWSQSFGSTADGILQPFLMRCHIPEHFAYLIPVSVSISEKPCGKAFNNIRVTYNLPIDGKKKNFAICVKGMDFMYSDHSVRLVEWLELVSLLGADKVYMYVLGTHDNYTKVLDYYQAKGLVDVRKTTLPGDHPGAPSIIQLYRQGNSLKQYQNELIPLNDCFYRNLYLYKLIALIDIDEVIIPLSSDSWASLLNTYAPKALSDERSDIASYYFRNIYFLDDMQEAKGWAKDIPPYMHMLQHVQRAPNYTGKMDYAKSFHNPDVVLTLHNHLPFACLNSGACQLFAFHPKDGHLQHYCKDCPRELADACTFYREHPVSDTSLWRYKDQLIQSTTNALKQIGYFRDIKKTEY